MSFVIAQWLRKKVALLIASLTLHVKADKIGRLHCNIVLKRINKYWDSEVTSFFWSYSKSKKTFRKLAYLATNCYPC